MRKVFNLENNWKTKRIPFSSLESGRVLILIVEELLLLVQSEFVFKDNYDQIKDMVNEYPTNYRVLVLAKSNYEFKEVASKFKTTRFNIERQY